MYLEVILLTILLSSIVIPVGAVCFHKKEKRRFKIAIGFNAAFFFGTLMLASVLLFSGRVSAAEAADVAEAATNGWKYIGAALAVGMSCIGAGIAVASAASSALGALSENSSLMGKAMIFVALAESVALYGLLIAFTILRS